MELPISPTIAWAVLGLVLLVVEIFTTSFFVLFFGVGALVVAGLKAAGLLSGFTAEVLTCSAVGLSGLFFFRRKLVVALKKGPGHAIDRHQEIVASAAIPPGGEAKIEYQGTLWDATNAGDRPVQAGGRVAILSTKGIKLVVTPKDR